MRKSFTKVVSIIVLAVMLMLSVSSASVKSFSDVPKSYWGYETIMRMAEEGIFKGTTEPVNGVAKFSPEDDMTRAEFITASLRATFTEASDIGNDSKVWWRKYYYFALEEGILIRGELDDGQLDEPMTREEMAMIMVRCVEAMGEKLAQRIKWTQIPDYSEIDTYFKYYVRDCYSYGLLCGIDDDGTFDPKATLTRAEAATVICRLIDKDMRVDINFKGESSGKNDDDVDIPNDDYVDEDEPNNNGNQDDSDGDYRDPFPWEFPGAKKPSQYTWDEFEKLKDFEQEAFFEWFGTAKAFETWMNEAKNTTSDDITYPWDDGGKTPDKYTWDEFEALEDFEKEGFFEWFDTVEAFDIWKDMAEFEAEYGRIPWNHGGKNPDKYSLDEFTALTPELQEMFFEWFESFEAFEKWKEKADFEDKYGEIPWEHGGKTPDKYTLNEFNALSAELQEMFFEWFESADAFEAWMNRVQ